MVPERAGTISFKTGSQTNLSSLSDCSALRRVSLIINEARLLCLTEIFCVKVIFGLVAT